jgi:hypothetical protein
MSLQVILAIHDALQVASILEWALIPIIIHPPHLTPHQRLLLIRPHPLVIIPHLHHSHSLLFSRPVRLLPPLDLVYSSKYLFLVSHLADYYSHYVIDDRFDEVVSCQWRCYLIFFGLVSHLYSHWTCAPYPNVSHGGDYTAPAQSSALVDCSNIVDFFFGHVGLVLKNLETAVNAACCHA